MTDSDLLPIVADASRNGEKQLDAVVPLLYEEIRRLAHRELRREQPGHTLSTTGLAHEAYLELSRLTNIEWKSRAHFFSVCGRVIRNVLVDYAVERRALKRGGGEPLLPLDEAGDV